MLILSHGKADVEHGFNLNDKLLVESMQEQSLIAQRVINARMLSNGYLTHNVPITKDLTHSLPMHPFKRKKKISEENWEKWKDRLLEWRTYIGKLQKSLFWKRLLKRVI